MCPSISCERVNVNASYVDLLCTLRVGVGVFQRVGKQGPSWVHTSFNTNTTRAVKKSTARDGQRQRELRSVDLLCPRVGTARSARGYSKVSGGFIPELMRTSLERSKKELPETVKVNGVYNERTTTRAPFFCAFRVGVYQRVCTDGPVVG